VTEAIATSAESFECSPVLGVLSHNLNKDSLDGDSVIINKTDDDNKVRSFDFEANQAFCINIVMSTGNGKTSQPGVTTEKNYSLKMKASGVNLGITECESHGLLQAYPVVCRKSKVSVCD
jgi:hypothetical protein